MRKTPLETILLSAVTQLKERVKELEVERNKLDDDLASAHLYIDNLKVTNATLDDAWLYEAEENVRLHFENEELKEQVRTFKEGLRSYPDMPEVSHKIASLINERNKLLSDNEKLLHREDAAIKEANKYRAIFSQVIEANK